MSVFYDNVLLREEFNLVQKLQKDKEFEKYITVKYEDRVTGEKKTVLSQPNADKYPEIYFVDYRMPVYVAAGRLRNDFHGTAVITLSEPVLTNRLADNGPHVEWDSNFEPFNNHIRKNWICTGNAWTVAKDNGLWHLIISLGALINQDEFVCAEGVHIDEAAYNYWIRRNRKPVTNINWALDLLTRTENPKFTIVRKTAEQPTVKKFTIIKK